MRRSCLSVPKTNPEKRAWTSVPTKPTRESDFARPFGIVQEAKKTSEDSQQILDGNENRVEIGWKNKSAKDGNMVQSNEYSTTATTTGGRYTKAYANVDNFKKSEVGS
jgi:hypothetical protein